MPTELLRQRVGGQSYSGPTMCVSVYCIDVANGGWRVSCQDGCVEECIPAASHNVIFLNAG